MSESLLQKLERMEDEISKLKLITGKAEVAKHDFNPEISKFNTELNNLKSIINNNKIDVKKEIEKVVNETYITNLYRNK